MKAFRRFLLLGTFAALGAGAAIYVGVASDPSMQGRFKLPRPGRQTTHWAIVTNDKPVVVAPQPRVGSEFAPPDRVALSEHEQFLAPAESTRLAQAESPQQDAALQYLRQQMTALPLRHRPYNFPPPLPGLPAAAAPKSNDLLLEAPSPPAANAVKAPALPAPAPATATAPPPVRTPVVVTPVPAAAPEPAAKSPRPMVKASGEGDGKLTIHIQNADLREVLDMLSEQGGLNILAGKEVQGKVSATLTGVDIETALGAILKSTGYTSRRQGKFLFVGTPEEFNSMEQALDRVGTRVYRPNYVTAAELKILVQPLMTEKIGMVSVSTPSEVGIAASDATAGGDKFAGGDVVLVRDYEAVLAQVDQIVAEVDVRPLQVCIEAEILDVKLNDTDQFGVDFALLQDHLKFGWGTPATSLANLQFDQGGLKFGYLDGNVGAFVNALEQIADTRVIGKPRLMVLNKHRAEILIGAKKGYVSTTVTETSSTQTVDFLETGVQLRLRPFISRDGLVRMEVHPELSDGDVTVTGNFTLPNKTLTEVTTNVMVHDGCTMVLGGLIKEQLTNSTAAVPVLGSLPWVGGLFRDSTQTIERDELIVLITPRIVYEPATCQEGSKAACEFHRAEEVYADKMSPFGKRSIGRRYFRLAQAAWSRGDREAALRFVEMSIHFDPMNTEAVNLRADMWQGSQAGEPPLDRPPVAAGNATGGPQIAPWMIDDLERQGPPPAAQLHPYDPGQPGLHKDIQRPRILQ